MNHLPTEYSRLLCRHILRSLPPDEQEALEKHVEECDELMYVFETVTDPDVFEKAKEVLDPIDLTTALNRVKAKGKLRFKVTANASIGSPISRIIQFNKWPNPLRVAACVAAIGLAGFLVTTNTGKKGTSIIGTKTQIATAPIQQETITKPEDSSAHNAATIKEGDEIRSGDFTFKMKNGRLFYNITTNKGTAQSHTLEIPGGMTVPVTLPDGSNILLNALSSMKVMSLADGIFHLIVTGEVYAESANSPSSRLTLEVKDRMQIEIGKETQVNINAYADEPTVKTSILKGGSDSKIIAGSKTALLKPGQEARFRGDSLVIVDMDAIAIDAAKAWKDGMFHFNSANLESIMRQIARWYNVDVVYESRNTPTKAFNTSLRRDTPLKDLMEALNVNGIPVKQKGRKLVVGGD